MLKNRDDHESVHMVWSRNQDSLLVSNLQLQETVSHSAEKNSKQLKPEVIPAHISSPHFQLNHKHFYGACPQTPLTQSILRAPLFLFTLGLSPILLAVLFMTIVFSRRYRLQNNVELWSVFWRLLRFFFHAMAVARGPAGPVLAGPIFTIIFGTVHAQIMNE